MAVRVHGLSIAVIVDPVLGPHCFVIFRQLSAIKGEESVRPEP